MAALRRWWGAATGTGEENRPWEVDASRICYDICKRPTVELYMCLY